jgi:hypothetical protein
MPAANYRSLLAFVDPKNVGDPKNYAVLQEIRRVETGFRMEGKHK